MTSRSRTLTIRALGVGHGDATLIEFADPTERAVWTCLVDGGESPRVLRDRLVANGVTRLDLLVCTHADQDHVGGLSDLASHVDVAEYWGPALPAFERHEWLFGDRARDTIRRCRALEDSLGDARIVYPVEGYTAEPLGERGPRIAVLSPAARLVRHLLTRDDVMDLFTSSPMPLGWLTVPEPADVDEPERPVDRLDDLLDTRGMSPDELKRRVRVAPPGDRTMRDALAAAWAADAGAEPEFFGDSVLNDTSLVLWIDAPIGNRRFSVLLTGDQENWTYLLFRHPRGLHADVYKASHHGGRVYLESDEAHDEVMASIRPRVVLMSANGRHGLPRSAVRDSAIRWGASVSCTSGRDSDAILSTGAPASGCHASLGCSARTSDAGIVISADGIRSTNRLCHVAPANLGQTIQVRQHVLAPSPIAGRLFDRELAGHIRRVQKWVRKLAAERRPRAPEDMVGGAETIAVDRLLALMPLSEQARVRAHIDEILRAGMARGRFWARESGGFPLPWRVWERPGPKLLDDIVADLSSKTGVFFSDLGDPRRVGPNSLVMGLRTDGLARYVDERWGVPIEVFDWAVWPTVIRFLRDQCHVYAIQKRWGRKWCIAFTRAELNPFLERVLSLTFRRTEKGPRFSVADRSMGPLGDVVVGAVDPDRRDVDAERRKAIDAWVFEDHWWSSLPVGEQRDRLAAFLGLERVERLERGFGDLGLAVAEACGGEPDKVVPLLVPAVVRVEGFEGSG